MFHKNLIIRRVIMEIRLISVPIISVVSFLCISLIFPVSLIHTSSNAETKHETPVNRSASTFLPKDIIKGPHYEVQDKVVSYGYMDNFTVNSDYDVFEVTGDLALMKLIGEIGAITALQNMKDSDIYKKAAAEAAKSPLMFGKNLVTDPVDTVTGVPKGVGRMFSNAYKGLTTKNDPGEDDTAKSVLKVSECKREYAAELNVDVYSSNKALQKELNSVGWACAAGGLSLSVLTMPISNPALKVAKNLGTAQTLTDAMKDNPPSRLRIVGEEKLKEMGVSEELTKEYLDSEVYTPRHNTIIVASLMKLEGAEGRDKFIEFAIIAQDEVEANFFMNMAQIMRGYNESVSPIKKITVIEPFVLAEAENGVVLVPFPIDHGVWTEKADTLTTALIDSYKDQGGKGKMDMWLTGTLSPRASKNLNAKGIKTTEKVGDKITIVF